MNQQLTLSYELSEQDIIDIHQLEKQLRALRGIHYKLDMLTCENSSATKAHILCREEEELTGYIAMNYFSHGELEMTAMMKEAEHYFQDVYRLAADKGAEIGARRMLLISDRNDSAMTSLATGAGMRSSFTEYRMSLYGQPPASVSVDGLSLRSATLADSAYIAGLDDDSFQHDDQPAIGESIDPHDLAKTRIAKLNGERIGKIRIDECDGVFGLYGFVIAPEYRGKGYGRAILDETLRQIMGHDCRKIYLEVDADNPVALHLYESCGFKVDAIFDYYEQRWGC